MRRTRLYTAWSNMKQRCCNRARPDYPTYGGRGITICPEWAEDFSAFMAWALDNGYKDHLTLDRIDTNGPYSPGNCRWVTRKAQANNRRTNRLLTLYGKTQSMGQWAQELGIGSGTLWRRLHNGWSVERALTMPVQKKQRRVRS